ncbi:MAG: hypothetical protein HY060_23155, partial [Proteobacteria bacterium]|nr:hypothetical protein [Pseudomonadota bacterium]
PPPLDAALVPDAFFHGQAFKLAMVDSRFLDAFDIALLLGSAAIDPLLEPERWPGLTFGAAIDAVCRTVATVPDAPGLLLDGGFGPPHDALVAFIAGLPHGRTLKVERFEAADAPRTHVVLAADDARRAARLAEGHRPGLTFSLESLLPLFRL